MEYIQMKPNNIDVYVNEFHTRIKYEFEKSINKMYNEEINVYRDFIETIVKLPFIQLIIEENKTLKAKLQLLEENNSNHVKLEIIDKPVSKTVLDIENIPFDTTNDDEDDSSTDDEDDNDDSSSDEDEDNNCVDDIQVKEKNGDMEEQLVKKADQIKPEEPSADEEEEEQAVDEEEEEQAVDEEEEEPSADEEEEEPSADQGEHKSPTFPIIKVNKMEGNNNLEEVNVKKVVEEEIETETEEEPLADPVEESSVDEVVEIEIDGVTYYCDDEENGNIYEDDNGEVGNIVGEIKDGEALFFE